MKKTKLSIGIPTYEAGEGLVLTLKSIYNQTFYKSIDNILVLVDGKKISKAILKKIANDKLIVKSYKIRRGQSIRINDILSSLNSKNIILTNDDICLGKEAVENFYKNKKYGLVAGCVKPFKSSNFLTKSINIGSYINHKIALGWNRGDNYLSCNGRLVMISEKLKKKIVIPPNLWNSDAYMYLICKKNKLKFKHEEKSECYFQNPQKIRDYLSQSSKFQNSRFENSHFIDKNMAKYYKVPIRLLVSAFLEFFTKFPIYTVVYIFLAIYARLVSKTRSKKIPSIGYWKTDHSTKIFYSHMGDNRIV